MKLESNFLVNKVEQWMLSLLPEQPWYNILRELYAKEGIAGDVSQNLPSPEQWGWTDPDNWKPLWTTLPEASSSSRELLSCGCKKGCRG